MTDDAEERTHSASPSTRHGAPRPSNLSTSAYGPVAQPLSTRQKVPDSAIKGLRLVYVEPMASWVDGYPFAGRKPARDGVLVLSQHIGGLRTAQKQ